MVVDQTTARPSGSSLGCGGSRPQERRDNRVEQTVENRFGLDLEPRDLATIVRRYGSLFRQWIPFLNRRRQTSYNGIRNRSPEQRCGGLAGQRESAIANAGIEPAKPFRWSAAIRHGTGCSPGTRFGRSGNKGVTIPPASGGLSKTANARPISALGWAANQQTSSIIQSDIAILTPFRIASGKPSACGPALPAP